ncbi:metal-dependent hydrolase [Fictibacillus enclensis]|uniref:metal-dependent hydrolase n=1 Tax=Fictibacillus enclensis TaxID=1017270 RepID=UPI0025A2B202|nr:metal-dependent hydrolase [Fictibacillus enclensis]MDM5338516.1 metal-dependent hydrolase [Fictibacillus enclensis]
MKYKTHIAFSLAIGAGVANIIAIPFSIGYVAGLTLGSLLPDIDEPNSYIGRRSLGISSLINKRLGHRGLTHSLTIWLVFLVYCSIFPTYFTLGLTLGYLFHIIGDFFSVSSVPLLSPFFEFRPKNMLISYKTGSPTEEIIKITSIFVLVLFVLKGALYQTFFTSVGQILKDFIYEAVNK